MPYYSQNLTLLSKLDLQVIWKYLAKLVPRKALHNNLNFYSQSRIAYPLLKQEEVNSNCLVFAVGYVYL